MKRNWQMFWAYAFKSLKWMGVGILLVPLYFVLMNPYLTKENYWTNLLFSTRIGVQVALFCWISSTAIYTILWIANPNIVLSMKKSPKVQALKGIALMLIGLALTSITEPYISGRNFGLQSVTVGTLVGGITVIVTVLFVALRDTKIHNLHLRAKSAEGNLHVFRNQMQPHFLFNALNNLAELIDSNSEHASTMAQKLSDLYREILTSSKSHLSTLESEISIVEKYLDLEKIRYGDRLKFKISKPTLVEDIFLPSLSLQTLVENSIKHRVSKSLAGGQIDVSIVPSDSGFKVSVVDTGELESIEFTNSASTGTGLSNTKSRLSLIYGSRNKFSLDVTKNSTRIEFWITGRNENEFNT